MFSVERELERRIERCEDSYLREQLCAELILVERSVRERRASYGERA
jgi:hypothetical protein